MRKNMIKSVILVILTVIVILSLVGCVKLQKKTADTEVEKDIEKDAKKDTKEDKKQVSSVDDEVDKIKKEVDKVDEITQETKEADELDKTLNTTEENTATPDDGLPVKKVKEGDMVSFPNLKALDPDGDPITYTFTTPLGENGEWQTSVGDEGEYVVTITASDGKNEVAQQVRIIVETLNNAPIITLSTPKEITVEEGKTVTIDAQATDSDNDPVTLTFSGWMETSTKETNFGDEGQHSVLITASDGKTETTEEVTVIVTNVNRAPTLNDIAEITLKEGETVELSVEAEDPDGDDVTVTFGVPLGAQDGVWETKQGDAGTYEVEVTASDGKLEDAKTVKIIVQSLNNPPVIDLALPTINVEEGETVQIDAEITDPENDELTITYSGWMTSTSYLTDYDDAGTHVVTITVTDGINTATQDVTVNVLDKNRPPTFDPGAFS
ncbi:hypothetical protein KY333_05170 [Candidatus Woesearchaeota archaeon]|nr:hypothetical protein [Candidatus Woesearchaeota archaeon]